MNWVAIDKKAIMFLLYLFQLPVRYSIGQTLPDVNDIAETITSSDLKNHLYALADEDMEGRHFGSYGERKAANYITNSWNSSGLLPGFRGGWEQVFALYQDSIAQANIEINGKQYGVGEDFSFFMNRNTTEFLQVNEILFLGYGIHEKVFDNYRDIDVNGKVVLMLMGEPMINDSIYKISGNKSLSHWSTFDSKVAAATKQGAVAVLIVNDNIAEISKYNSVSCRSDLYPLFKEKASETRPNLYFISSRLANTFITVSKLKQLVNEIEYRPEIIRADIGIKFVKNRLESGLYSRNVIGLIEGSDKKDEYVFITAHYDHNGKDKNGEVYYGADDNASGTSALLEIASAFGTAKKMGISPKRTIVFIGFSAEECGLWGSRYYVENPVYPLNRTIVNLNIDMIGRIGNKYKDNKDSTNYMFTIGDDSISPQLRVLNDAINERHTKLKLDKEDIENYYSRSDHFMFAKSNIPVIFYTNGRHDDYHKKSDTPDKINYALLVKRTKLIFFTAWELANMNQPPVANKKPHKSVTALNSFRHSEYTTER